MDSTTKGTYQAPSAVELRAALYDLVTQVEAMDAVIRTSQLEQGTIARLEHTLKQCNVLLRGEAQLWHVFVPVLTTAHLKQDTLAKLCDAIGAREHAGALHNGGDDGAWAHVPEVFTSGIPGQPETSQFPDDLCTVFKWAQERGFSYIRFDSMGDTFDDLPVYEWKETPA